MADAFGARGKCPARVAMPPCKQGMVPLTKGIGMGDLFQADRISWYTFCQKQD